MNLLPASTATPTILVVDDAPDQVLVLQGLLEEAGCRVLTAPSGWAGLAMALAQRPDLILLDFLMPNLDGAEVLRALLADPRTCDVPVIFLTILGGAEAIAAGLDAGARDYILKPFHAQELLARVRTQLEWKRCRDRERALNSELSAALVELQQLSELLPLCTQCKKVRDDPDFYRQVQGYLASHGQARSQAGRCPDCQGASREAWNREVRKELPVEQVVPAGHGSGSWAAAPVTSLRPAPMETRRARILLVEDDPASMQTLIQFLRADYKLLVATNGLEALETAQREEPDLILLDVVMDGMDGHQVCRALKQNAHTRHIPVMFVTGRDEEEDEITGLSLGAVDYIVKPFSLPVVRQRIRAQLDLKRFQDLLEYQSMTDSLTGLPNRRHLQLSLEYIWRQTLRQQAPLSVILMDVDLFKAYNDQHGHQAGDECLKFLARALDSVRRRTTDLVARFGGEEFICLLPGMGLQGAVAHAEAIRKAVEAIALPHGASEAAAHVTLSLGVACSVPTSGDQAATLIEAADQALYVAKRTGRNRVAIAGQETPVRLV